MGLLLSWMIGITVFAPAKAYAGHAYIGFRLEKAGTAGEPVRVNVVNGNYDTPLRRWAETAAEDVSYSWNAYTNFYFDFRGGVDASQAHSTSYNTNRVMYDYIDGPGGTKNKLGLNTTTFCAGTTFLCRSHIPVEETGATFYKGGAGIIPAGQADLWTIAHELGHSIHLKDLLDSDSACPSSSGRATMCGDLYVGNGVSGWISSPRTPNTTEDVTSANAAVQTCPPNPCP